VQNCFPHSSEEGAVPEIVCRLWFIISLPDSRSQIRILHPGFTRTGSGTADFASSCSHFNQPHAFAGCRSRAEQRKNSVCRSQKQALSAILKDPCNTLPADINRMAKEFKVLAESAQVGDQGDDDTLRQTRASACRNAKDGGLPPFESALWVMTDARRLDPCSY
jgi:hypothetical protein